ncbi:hypothetical protein [Candidatus Coxiella mudrowiae]|nr:hypothetical protein [Candidatus Coxiella mudrowiae]
MKQQLNISRTAVWKSIKN